MKDQMKSEKRMLQAMKLGFDLCNEGSELSWNDIAKVHKISNSFSTALIRFGIVTKKSNKVFEWIGEPPSIELVKKIKSDHIQRYHYKEFEDKTFEEKTIDDKINHLEFMIDQIFDRVNYIFESLADDKIKSKVDSTWYKDK